MLIRNFSKALGLSCTLALMPSAALHAGNLVLGAQIVKVANTRDNVADSFIVITQGGSGPCSSASFITFAATGAYNTETLKRAYAAALLAFSTGSPVTINNPSNNACDGAVYIEIG